MEGFSTQEDVSLEEEDEGDDEGEEEEKPKDGAEDNNVTKEKRLSENLSIKDKKLCDEPLKEESLECQLEITDGSKTDDKTGSTTCDKIADGAKTDNAITDAEKVSLSNHHSNNVESRHLEEVKSPLSPDSKLSSKLSRSKSGSNSTAPSNGNRPNLRSRSRSSHSRRSAKNERFCFYFKWNNWMRKREEYSLFIFSPKNIIRRKCKIITAHESFDYAILIFIGLNCVTLAMERPKIPPWAFEREFLTCANYIFTAVFALEMLLKVISTGLIYGEKAYFKSGWNVMDGALVGFSLFDLTLGFFAQKSPKIFGVFRVFRLLRSLRPLR